MRPRVLLAVARTAFREFVRTPEAVFWTYGFPLVMALGLGIAFAGGEVEPVRAVIAIDDAGEAARARAATLQAALVEGSQGRITVTLVESNDAARRELARGAHDVQVSGTPAQPIVDVDRTRPEAELALFWVDRALDRVVGGEASAAGAVEPSIRPITERGSRYIDFLIPGLIGVNLLGAGMYGVGFNIVQMRVRNLLRRLFVTPMRPAEFLFAFLSSRLVLVVPEALFVVLFGVLAFDVPIHGSLALLCLLVVAGGLAFSGLGLLIAARARTVESVSGWINLATLPMWILGGSFFSNERFPQVLQPLIRALPLTQLNDGLRAIMLGGAGPIDVWVPLIYLFGFAAACLWIAVRIFRWSSA